MTDFPQSQGTLLRKDPRTLMSYLETCEGKTKMSVVIQH